MLYIGEVNAPREQVCREYDLNFHEQHLLKGLYPIRLSLIAVEKDRIVSQSGFNVPRRFLSQLLEIEEDNSLAACFTLFGENLCQEVCEEFELFRFGSHLIQILQLYKVLLDICEVGVLVMRCLLLDRHISALGVHEMPVWDERPYPRKHLRGIGSREGYYLRPALLLGHVD